jgi:hypothetical protein
LGLTKYAAERAGEVAPKTLNRSIPLEVSGQPSGVRTFTYQRERQGAGRNNGYYLPAVIGPPAALRAWLETRLRCKLATLEIEHPTQLAEWQPETMPIGELVSVLGGWMGEVPEGDDG